MSAMAEAVGDPDQDKRSVVLVVEDEVLVMMAVAGFLRDSGFQVIEAFTGEEALTVLSSHAVDLVFTDVNLPGAIDGLGIAEWALAHRPDLPVIVTSGGPTVTFAGRPLIGRHFLAKPYAYEKLVELIRTLVPQR